MQHLQILTEVFDLNRDKFFKATFVLTICINFFHHFSSMIFAEYALIVNKCCFASDKLDCVNNLYLIFVGHMSAIFCVVECDFINSRKFMCATWVATKFICKVLKYTSVGFIFRSTGS